MCQPASRLNTRDACRALGAIGERGIALLIVVSLLTVIGIMGVAFAFSMHLETQETRQFVSTTQARYLAEAGIAYARALLDDMQRMSREDDLTQGWVEYVRGAEADTDGDRLPDARWWMVKDANQGTVGRFALKITDEAGKANLNAAAADPAAVSPGAISLVTLLQKAGLDPARAANAAQAIQRYRYGPDERPGRAGVDDNGDGVIDDPGEYDPLAPRGDDRRIESLDELVRIAGLTPEEVQRLSAIATVYSWDLNVSTTGKARVNVNTATAEELLAVLLDAGVKDPWQAAVNMADYVDADVAVSRLMKSSQFVAIPDQGPVGGWVWSNAPSGHYESSQSDGSALVWSTVVPTGSFRILVRGLDGTKVGDVTVAGQTIPSVDSDQSLGMFQLSGTLEIRVTHHEPPGTLCAFRGIELVAEGAQNGVMVRGIEAVRFNELMVEPVLPLAVSREGFDPQGSDWGCPLGSSVCTNSGVGRARWVWSNDLLRPQQRYYIRVLGSASGQKVGEVTIDGKTELLAHGQVHSSTLLVGSDRKITLTIGKTASEGTYYFKGIEVSLQPDGEYVELINLSDRPMDISGWTIDGELAGGRRARLPNGAVIKPHGLLVAAVDLDDTQTGLAGNGIAARSAWEMSDQVTAVQLEFPDGVPTPDDDWLKVTLPPGATPRLTLRNGDAVVDEVQYPLPLPVSGFQSLEKGDPSIVVDTNADGIDEGWYPSLRLYTPGLPNDNEGLREVVGSQTIVHDPSKEITVLNRPLAGVGELAGLPSGQPWKPFSSTDLAKIVDRLTVYGYRLEAEDHFVEELDGQNGWQEKAGGYYEHTDPQKADVIGRWRWTNLVDGHYRLSLYGWSGEQLSVRWQRSDESLSEWSPALSTDAQGRLVIGQIAIGAGDTPSATLTLDVRCASPSGVCHLDNIRLDPQLIRVGPVNVNTAPVDVLMALPGMTEALASRIIAGRPYGDRNHKARGIGDLLVGDTLGTDEEGKLAVFRRVAHLLTTRSHVFNIISLGQALTGDRTASSQRIQTVVNR